MIVLCAYDSFFLEVGCSLLSLEYVVGASRYGDARRWRCCGDGYMGALTAPNGSLEAGYCVCCGDAAGGYGGGGGGCCIVESTVKVRGDQG